MRTLGRFFLIVGMLCSPAAWADVAMLTQMSGQVTLVNKDGSRAAVAFIKMATGDKLALGSDGRVQVVYFGNGRQEIWSGAGQVEIAGLEGRSASLKPQTSQLPPLVINQLAKTPAAGQQGRAGMVLVRSLENPDALDHLEKQYKEMKLSAQAGDTTPELFLLSGLIELKEFPLAREALAGMAGKPGYESLVQLFTPLTTR